MDKNSKKMVIMQLVFSIFKSFVLIFVNIYLWKTGKNIKAVAVFNIFNYIAAFVSFYLGNRVALKNTKLNYLMSSLCFILLFVVTSIMGDNISNYAILIGILGGFGDGLFYFNLNVFQASDLNRDQADSFMSIIGIVTKISSVVTPIISGITIEKFGFAKMAYVIIILLIIQIANAITLPNRKIEYVAKPNFKHMFSIKSYRRVILTHLVHTPYGQFIIMANSVFLFSFAKSESLMGLLNSLFAISGIILYYTYIKVQKKVSRNKLMFIGAIALGLSMSLLFRPSFTTFVVFSLSISIGDAFFNKPLTGIQIYVSGKYGRTDDELLGNLVFRTFLLTVSRTIFYLLIYFFYVDNSSFIFRILLVHNIISPFLSYFLCKEEI
ncbi:MFS transporter [Brassicibacter mesophilus]|uniref:MFS transporter n=1 Tax=Brassicibacter mesophilus TaxID=745119 RepID=UPI003D1F2682